MAAPAPPRVLDTTSGIAGAYAALLLHQAGADVVRRSPADDDPQLPDGSPLVGYLRQGQRRVATTDDPLTSALGADVLLATPTAADRDALLAIREAEPGVVVVAITPYGLDGPYRDRPASDLTLAGRQRRAGDPRQRRRGADPDGGPHHRVAGRRLRGRPPRRRCGGARRGRVGRAGRPVAGRGGQHRRGELHGRLPRGRARGGRRAGDAADGSSRPRRSSAPPTAGSASTRTPRTR